MFPAYTTSMATIPSQMKTLREKMANKQEWAKKNVDAFESIGRQQYFRNRRFLENYQMVNGQFIMSHYVPEEGYKDFISALSNEFEIPSTLRHYDIIGKVLNNLTEKLAEFPDVFRVKEIYEDIETNEFIRDQTSMMHNAVKADIYNEIKRHLVEQGLDPEKSDFASEEEAMQYQKEVQELSQAMTPPQINEYMKTSWQGQGEKWGSHQLAVNKEKYKLPEMERLEFRDMLITDRCFRHFYLTPDGYSQESWNPVNTFIHESDTVQWAQDGDYVGRMLYFSKSQIIDRYGWLMQPKVMKRFEQMDHDNEGGVGSGKDMTGYPYNNYAPFPDHKAWALTKSVTGYDPFNALPEAGADLDQALRSRTPYVDRYGGLYRVTEVYWTSMKKFGKVVYIDPLTGRLTKANVDETYVVPENFKEITGDFTSGDQLNTVYWTWVKETWKGVKIAATIAENDDEAIYIDLAPMNFQFKSDSNPFGAKLPVCGRVFNNRNSQSMGLVDLMKPHQIGHNLCMNQLYQIIEKETGKFMVWDANFFNTLKDWGGEDSFEKIQMLAKELGHVFADTSPQNMKGANAGNTFPKVIDLDLTAQMMSRAKLAEFFEGRALSQLGISMQLMGEVKATETATGINTGVSQATLNVQRFYTDFMEYKQRCLSMDLEMSQYVQSTNKDIFMMYSKSDQSREWIRTNGTNLLLRNMHVFVMNSQELLRQMEMIKNYFVNNNTLNMSPVDIVEVITQNSPAAIKAKLQVALDKQQDLQQTQMQQQQQQIDQQGQIAQMQEEKLDERTDKNNETKIHVAEIAATGRMQTQPTNFNSQPDNNLEYSKFAAQTSANEAKNSAQRESNNIKRAQNVSNNSLKQRELALKEKELKVKEKKYKAEVKVAVVNK